MEREFCRGKVAGEIIKDMLEELEHIRKKIGMLQDFVDSCIAKAEGELKKDLECIWMDLEALYAELKDYCIGDCSLCSKNCDIECNVDCYKCVRFFKCLKEKKVSRMVFD